MIASLIIVVPSLPLAQAEYYHPGRALFQVQVSQGLFRLHFSRFTIQVLQNRQAIYGVQCFQRHHILSGRQLSVMFYPAFHLLRSVLDYLAWSKIYGGCFFFLTRTKCLLDFIVHMALIITFSTAEWILAQSSGQYSFAQRLLLRCTLLRAASRACRFCSLDRVFYPVNTFSFLLLLELLSLHAPRTSLQICFSSCRSWAWLFQRSKNSPTFCASRGLHADVKAWLAHSLCVVDSLCL